MQHAGMSLITTNNPAAQMPVCCLVTKIELKYVLSHVGDLLCEMRLSYCHPSLVSVQGQPLNCSVPQERPPSIHCTVTQGSQPPVLCTVTQEQPVHCNITQDQTISYAIMQEDSSTNDGIGYFSDLTSPSTTASSISDSSSLAQISQASFKSAEALNTLLSLSTEYSVFSGGISDCEAVQSGSKL
jgi:hypothetical protein